MHCTLNVIRYTLNVKRMLPCSIAAFCLIAVFGGCRPQEADSIPPRMLCPEAIDGARAFEEVRQLVAITPRHSGTEGNARAADHLLKQLRPHTDTSQIVLFEDTTPKGTKVFRNVVGLMKGQGTDLVILASHFDTKSGVSEDFQGANDSGSSSGLLVELARVLQAQRPLPFSVLFAFLDGEECIDAYGTDDGLHGSRSLVDSLKARGELKHVKAMILLDMIGDRDLTVTIPRNVDKHLLAVAFDAAHCAEARPRFSLLNSAILDDHVPFLNAGVPAINLIDFQYGSRRGLNDYWHTDEDTLDRISPDSLQIVGRVVIHMLNTLARE
jgi:glutaminyl-peptide cyclotransferase